MNDITKPVKIKIACEKGISLIAMAFMILVLGGFVVAGSFMYDVWGVYRDSADTDEKLDDIQIALQRFLTENGRYPCPAPLDAGIDTAGYGVEVNNDCTLGGGGTFAALGRGNRVVRTGAVPVRTLGIADSYSHDNYRHRLIYAVTEDYTVLPAPISADSGAIAIIDGNGNAATAVPGNVVQIVYSMGEDRNGSFGINGVSEQNCNPAARSGENCDFAVNATFLNVVGKSKNANNLFVHSMAYVPSKTVVTCSNAGGVVQPGDTAFIVDTSGSMGWAGLGSDGFTVQCPAAMPGCSRMDVARWAMRRVMPAVIYNKNNNNQNNAPGQTSLTGFVGYNTAANVNNNLVNIIFDDPTAVGYVPPDEATIATGLEVELQGMCPSGSTPLGLHIKELADELGDGNVTRPNKITIISDGMSNNGNGNNGQQFDPLAAAQYIQANYPYVEVDIIDVVGNPSLLQVSQITGGTYYQTNNPNALLDALYDSAGVCGGYTPTPPVDQQGCGSQGGWWNNN